MSEPIEPRVVEPLAGAGGYALVGDTRTAGLSSAAGSVDWLCLPRFDGAPVFGALVGGPSAGRFAVRPAEPERRAPRRRYLPGTCTVETEWEVDGGRLVLTEGMVSDVAGTGLADLVLVRRVEAEGRPIAVRIEFDPRFGWDRAKPRTRRFADAVIATSRADAIALQADPFVAVEPGRPVHVEVTPGHPLTLVLTSASRAPLRLVPPLAGWRALKADEAGWRQWVGTNDPATPYRDAVERSLLTLRLLTYSPSGAPVAAPTTSLPEEIGGSRNWDYRYAWPRDASIGIAAFLGVGRPDEAVRFMTWLLHASRLDRPRLPPMLTLFGTPVPGEVERAGWPGYAGSRPVRTGNAAAGQHQLDVYGWPLDAAELLTRHIGPLDQATWRALAAFADYAAASWHRPDAGLWEVRSPPEHFVHSKLMAWLALDRALRLAELHRTRHGRIRRWVAARAALRQAITEHGWSRRRRCYVRSFDGEDLDAALLLMPGTGFEPDDSERVRRTVDAVADELVVGGRFVHRYASGADGLDGTEGAFLPCSFWLVQALARTGRVERAAALMSQLLDLGQPLGLFTEEADPETGAPLGNYPQAFTHAALVQAALALRDATPVRAGGRAPVRTPHGPRA